MIRSLVAEFDQVQEKMVLRRNLERKNLEQALGSGATVWVDIVDPADEEIDWLAAQFNLSPAVLADLQRVDRRPGMLVYPNYLFLSLFEPQIRAGQVRGLEIHLVMTDTCFITVRRSEAEALEEAYERMAQSPEGWNAGVAYLMYLTAQYVIDAYYPLLDRISNQLNAVEEGLLDNRLTADEAARKPVYRIKQQLINLRQMVAPQREVISSVIGEARLDSAGNIRDLFRHLYERLLRIYDVIDSQRDLSSNVLDMMQNVESRKVVEAVNRLTVLSMIFLPLTFLSGLFELNFATTSEPIILPIPGGIMLVLVVTSMIISASLMAITFRRRGWI
ncbi:MAG: magnesium transporter CorA family protein [Chloroflexi bacterium]|nr:magnesium transporter CorA family protein [Chloroflexota bacterium]